MSESNGHPVDEDKLLSRDMTVGVVQDGFMSARVRVNNGNIVLDYVNRRNNTGVSVTFAPKAVTKYLDILSQAVKVAEGRA